MPPITDLPTSPPAQISAELRRRLQRTFDQARSLTYSDRPDFANALSLIGQIMAVDPGNILYIDLLLTTLRRRDSVHPGGVLRRLWKRTPLSAPAALARAVQASDWPAALRLVPAALSVAGIDAPTLAAAAAACAGARLPEAELRYRLAAANHQPSQAGPIRQLAEALERLGRFDDARDWWTKLLVLSPDDEAATMALANHSPPAKPNLVGGAPTEQDLGALLDQAAAAMRNADFDQANQLLKRATARGGGDLRIREAWDDLALRQSEHRLARGREQAGQHPSDDAAAVVAQLAADHQRLELAIAHARAERFPGDMALQLDLIRKLKRAHNFSGALARLAELETRTQLTAAALVERGECWQHLRQFLKAIDCFEAAAEHVPATAADETSLLARYRGAVLAEAMGRQAQACRWLSEILAVAPAFKDAQQRLDKLLPICDKTGFSGGDASSSTS